MSSPELAPGSFARQATCDGGDHQITVSWSGRPAGTVEYALRVADADQHVAAGGVFTHWLVYNVPVFTAALKQPLPPEVIQGRNDFGRAGYAGPCPPKGQPPHHYQLTVYALKRRLHINDSEAWADVSKRLLPLVLASGSLGAAYARR